MPPTLSTTPSTSRTVPATTRPIPAISVSPQGSRQSRPQAGLLPDNVQCRLSTGTTQRHVSSARYHSNDCSGIAGYVTGKTLRLAREQLGILVERDPAAKGRPSHWRLPAIPEIRAPRAWARRRCAIDVPWSLRWSAGLGSLRSLTSGNLVELTGIEPVTPCLQSVERPG